MTVSSEDRQPKRRYIPVSEAFEEWRTDPAYIAAYDALEREFAIASALIAAGSDRMEANHAVVGG